jgi:hypothetical protein
MTLYAHFNIAHLDDYDYYRSFAKSAGKDFRDGAVVAFE